MLQLVIVMGLCISASFQADNQTSEGQQNTIQNINLTQRAFNLDCGGIFTQKQFVIESKGYPTGYEENLDCAFLLTGENCPTFYNFQFLDFDLEKSLGCTKDRLEIENKGVLCGNVVGIRNYFNLQGILQLKFLSDDEVQGRGFRILVTRLPCNYDPDKMVTTAEVDKPETETTTKSMFHRNQNNLCTTDINDSNNWNLPMAPNYPNVPRPIYPNEPNYPGAQNYPNMPKFPFRPIFPSRPHGYYPYRPNYPIGPNGQKYPNQPNFPIRPNYPTAPSHRPGSIYSPGPSYLPSPIFPTGPNPPINSMQPNYPLNPGLPNQMNPAQPVIPPHYPSIPILPNSPTNLPVCCVNSYNTKRFYLSSPGFPYSNSDPSDCVYRIHKANNNICRLRMHFQFYWNGQQAPSGCEKGFLQIDGKYICGCRVGLKLISAFDVRWGNSPKVIRFRNEGYPKSVFSGFAIEVIQDECPRRYTPDESKSGEAKFHYYNDQVNRIAWPNLTQANLIEKAHIINESTEILDKNNAVDSTDDANSMVLKHYYFFDTPEDNAINVTGRNNQARDVEETTYVDTSSSSSFLPNGNDDYKCRMWGVLQWTLLAKEALWKKMSKCVANNVPVMQKCVELGMLRGYVQSPGYPYYYPTNLNLCYRFIKQHGYCGIRLHMVDFHLEDSNQCRKDYFLVERKFRYCGQSLQNTFTRLDLTQKVYEDVHFITDSQICGRGFRGFYEQIPCSDSEFPVPPVPPPTTTPTPVNPLPCGGQINDVFFTLEVYGYHQSTCNFNIIRNNPEVCRLEITFVSFDLPCSSEYLLVNNRKYCGQLSGQTILFNFFDREIPIVYQRYENSGSNNLGLRMRLNGRQVRENCEPDIEVPAERKISDPGIEVQAERLMKPNTEGRDKFKRLYNSSVEIIKRGDRDYEVVLTNEYDDVCGLIMNITQSHRSEEVCQILLKGRSTVECIPLTSQTLYVPYDANKIELTADNVDIINEISFKEVLCSDVQ